VAGMLFSIIYIRLQHFHFILPFTIKKQEANPQPSFIFGSILSPLALQFSNQQDVLDSFAENIDWA
jgi:hypothetical protein